MKLYYFETPNARKACAIAKHLKLPLSYVRVDLGKGEQKKPNFLAVNPNGLVPALEDGNLKLWESNAIMCHLAQTADSDLWPTDARQIEIIRWFSWSSEHLTRCGGTLFFENVVKPMFGLGEPDRAALAEAERDFKVYAAVLDGHLADRAYLVGDSLTLADFAVAAILPYAGPARLPLADFANVQRWHARLDALPAWREPFPEVAMAA